ncbi:ATP-binding cassette domain-containing protein [Krasilnikoviella flava]|uniref:Oleandomycin transport system ATP-binding protein n=1 Tax=Krasilnikoviella flava TaxID=526729 RepID=A0A1T5LED0_9MICO|nr:ATP-binding cassette domain-containing protein [Krasilnikoviella flava]SKC74362.1 oleandomycin transport system ATP-binding protein [Krasilnikoviella flava]
MSAAFEAEGLVKRFGRTTALDGVDLHAERGSVLGVLGPNGAGKTTAICVLATLLRADAGRAVVDGIDVGRDPVGVRRRIDLAASLVGSPSILFLDEPTTGLDPGKREELWQTIRSLADDGTTVLLTTQYLEEADALADRITVIDEGRVIAHDTPAGLKQQAGGQTVVVRPRDPAMTAAVADVVARATGGPVAPPRGGVVTASVDDERQFATVVRGLEEAGLAVTELALRLPSLDEVFRTLTARRTTTPQEES